MNVSNTTFGNDYCINYGNDNVTIEQRPWGSFEILYEDAFCKVKKIIIMPGERPSYQYHLKRKEDWFILQGGGLVTTDGEHKQVTTGSSIFIDYGVKHTIQNTDDTIPLIFIEVQTGEYFGEDDIVRVDDKYGRL